MKTAIIIFLSWCTLSLLVSFLLAGYRVESVIIENEALKRKLDGQIEENEMLSLKLVELQVGGWKHEVK